MYFVVSCVHVSVAWALVTGAELKSLPITYLLGQFLHLLEPVFG